MRHITNFYDVSNNEGKKGQPQSLWEVEFFFSLYIGADPRHCNVMNKCFRDRTLDQPFLFLPRRRLHRIRL